MVLAALTAAASLTAPLFYNIAPYSPGNEKTVAADMREYAARTGNKTVLYSLTLHPEGRPAMTKVNHALESYRALKAELAGSDVELGVLLQAIMGHWPRTDKEVEPWQRTVDADGREVRFCPLDPNYRNYIKTVAKLLAAEHPCFILGDDDIRAFSPSAECFCPLHVAEFNKRRGTDYTSEQMRAAVKAAVDGQPDYDTFMQLQREMVNGVAATIREGIDEVDPTIPAGTCMPGWCYRFNDQASRVIAAKGQPAIMRIANGNYHEWTRGPTAFAAIIQKTQSYYAFHHDKVGAMLSEADTYPHHLWSRSSTSWHAHLVMTLFTGLKGAKLWYVNAHKGAVPVNRNYTDVLAANKGLYRTLVKEMEGAENIGLIEPCLTRFNRWHPLKDTREGFVDGATWATKVLGRMGVPYTCNRDYTKDGVWTLAGDNAIGRLTDDDLKAILSHKVLLDGNAAVALTKRGFDDLIGVTAERRDTLFNGEVDAETGMKYRLFKSDNVPTLTALEGAKALTHLVYYPYSGASEFEKVAPGSTLFVNKLGGRIVAASYHLGVSIDQICSEERQEWLFRAIDALAGKGAVPCVVHPQDVSTLAARTKDGSLLLCVFNLNFDPMKTINLRLGGNAAVEVLEGDGIWTCPDKTFAGGLVRVARSVPCYGTAVLRIRRPPEIAHDR